MRLEGQGRVPQAGLWNVHGPYHIEAKYANGVTMIIDNNFTNGVRFEGADGWIFVSRGGARPPPATPPAPSARPWPPATRRFSNSRSRPQRTPSPQEHDHHLDWLTSIRTRQPAVTTPEEAHRSTSACILGWIAMKLGRKLRWDPVKEVFLGDDEANAMRSRPQRAPYGIERLLKNG